MSNLDKIPLRLERFNTETDQWETYWTHSKLLADYFLDNSDQEVYMSIGVVETADANWVEDFQCNRGCKVEHYKGRYSLNCG